MKSSGGALGGDREMIIKRRRLGSTYEKSPAQNTKLWFAINLGKIFFTIFITIAYLIILYVMTGVVIFIAQEVGDVWKDVDYADAYNGPYGLLLKVGGVLGILLYVFKDRPAKRG